MRREITWHMDFHFLKFLLEVFSSKVVLGKVYLPCQTGDWSCGACNLFGLLNLSNFFLIWVYLLWFLYFWCNIPYLFLSFVFYWKPNLQFSLRQLSLDSLIQVRRGADRAEIYSLAFSPTAQWLAVSSDKGTVHVFSLKSNLGNLGSDKLDSFSNPNLAVTSSTSSLSFIKGMVTFIFFFSSNSFQIVLK